MCATPQSPSPLPSPQGEGAKTADAENRQMYVDFVLYPLGKGHCAPRSRRGAVARHIVKDLHLQMLHCPRGGEPVPDLRGARLQTLQGQRRDGVDVFILQGLEGFVIQLLIEHKMAEPTRGQDGYPSITFPGFNSIPEGYA